MRPVSRLLSPAIDSGFSHYAGEQSRHVASKFFKNFASFGVSMPFGSSPAILVINQV
jgi:hypothetical protein